ncbi:NADP-dependent oxidoreductase [Thalassococcus sp. S3]|uniref:NADP-dependent oxidoreductase n=1 Tax=Thalassococcus sp. S3 TaxID=2017482 RepID=UPI0010246A5F|nr:NADP-dependent oxidoreductase [Thalassococcus sp. S3]QBF31143.1 NADP-dependent oxidoreductase [Thalassococcus sp. S3]
MTDQIHHVALASRPSGSPVPENFRFEPAPMPELQDGDVLVKLHYLSLDPYMRGRMDDAESYIAPVEIGGTMHGGGVGEIVASKSPDFKPGDLAYGMLGWTTHAAAPAETVNKIELKHGSMTNTLGVLGMPGFTGWVGLMEYGRPKAGETLVVAAATGPVGSMVGQLAKSLGLRVVGIAGGAEKCQMAIETFGFDACLDHRAHDDAASLTAALNAACPRGIDIYFENVGGKVLEAVLPLMNSFGRIPVCGMISWYNAGNLGESVVEAGLAGPKIWRMILVNSLSVTGFIILDHWHRYPDFVAEIGPRVDAGEIKFVEDIVEGLENAPAAFMGLLDGKNKGKQIVKIA